MAGRGTRTEEYGVPKPLIDIGGKTMVERAVQSLGLTGQYIFIKLWYNNSTWNKQINEAVFRCTTDAVIYEIDKVTEGPACTAIIPRLFIDNDKPLVVTNCDQIMKWNANKFMEWVAQKRDDGVVVTYGKKTKKNSYIRLDEHGYGLEVREKEIISDHSLNGIHYWARGKDFVWSVEEMVRRDERVNGEFYIAPSYNYLIERGMKISTYRILDEQHFAVGVPEDIDLYLKSEELK
jgi:dTDP-glucose pyrophosphorylase